MYDYLVFIGRFQPLHQGHENVIREALKKSKHVILFVGSSNCSRSPRNPFTFQERYEMLKLVFRHEISNGQIIIKPLEDATYNDVAWVSYVQRMVDTTILNDSNKSNPNVWINGLNDIKHGIIGFEKDSSSYYLKMFPDYDTVLIPSQFGAFNSTAIRKQFLQSSPIIPDSCSEQIKNYLRSFIHKDEFSWLVDEKEFYDSYKKSWENSPYPPFFVCVDSVVIQSGHILLVRRKNVGGKGLLALPGGHVNKDETLLKAVVRELKEETRISDSRGEIPPAMLESFIDDTKTRIFDDPNRSERGRVITQAFLFNLPDRKNLFKVRGDDDAEHAQWYKIGSLDSKDFYEDHWAILCEMIGISQIKY